MYSNSSEYQYDYDPTHIYESNVDVNYNDLTSHQVFNSVIHQLHQCQISCQRQSYEQLYELFRNHFAFFNDKIIKIILDYFQSCSFQQCFIPLMEYEDNDNEIENDPYEVLPTHPIETVLFTNPELVASRTFFYGLPTLLIDENFPLCSRCDQPLRLICQFYYEDLPYTFFNSSAPSEVINSISDTNVPVLQIFQCLTPSTCYRRSRIGNSISQLNKMTLNVNEQDNKFCEIVRWISVSKRTNFNDDTILDQDNKRSPFYYEPDYKFERPKFLSGWSTFNDLPTVGDAVSRYKVKIPRDLFFMLDGFMRQPQTDSEYIWQLEDKFGGFGVFQTQPPVPSRCTGCESCEQSMEIFLSFTKLADKMPRKDDKFHLLICPVHKHFYYYLFD